MELIIWVLVGLAWYGFGLWGSSIGFRKQDGSASEGWKNSPLFGSFAALTGPINLLVTAVFL